MESTGASVIHPIVHIVVSPHLSQATQVAFLRFKAGEESGLHAGHSSTVNTAVAAAGLEASLVVEVALDLRLMGLALMVDGPGSASSNAAGLLITRLVRTEDGAESTVASTGLSEASAMSNVVSYHK